MPQLNHLLLAVTLVVSSAAIAGCSSPTEQPVTLVQTKSPVQLLRNAVAGRVAAGAISEVQSTQDVSVECGAGDPHRRWISGAELVITQSWTELIPGISTSLVESYQADGWTATTSDGGLVTLDNSESLATIEISVSDGAPARISVEVSGPCVLTDGADSDEVRNLEGVDA
jgi:hypothetical protein